MLNPIGVTRGLDPRGHGPALAIPQRWMHSLSGAMNARVKPGHDEEE
jgi:hypothetical protein